MKLILRLLGGLAVLVLLLVLVAFVLPKQYRVERTIVINAPAAKIHPLLADMRGWAKWGVWFERDPEIKNIYSPEQAVVGAWTSWESKKEGNGKATLTEVSPTRIAYQLEFPDMGMRSVGVYELRAEGNATRIVWHDSGDLGYNPLNRWFGLFLDGMLGPDFEAGLAKLKRITEA